MRTLVSTGAYDDIMSGNRGYGPKKDVHGNKIKLFSTALSDRGTLNAVLLHLIKTQAWGPNGPKELSDLYGQAVTSNRHDKGRKGHGSLSEMRIGLKLKDDSLALRPLKTDAGKIWIVETAHETYSYEENVSPECFAEFTANTIKLFKVGAPCRVFWSTVQHAEPVFLSLVGRQAPPRDRSRARWERARRGQSQLHPRRPVAARAGFRFLCEFRDGLTFAIRVNAEACLPSNEMQYADFEQPVKDYVVKVARDILKDDETGLPSLRGEKGLTGDLAKLYKRMFRLGKSPANPAIIVIGGGERHPLSLAQLGELLDSIMEDARKEVRDTMLKEGKNKEAASIPHADSSFVLDQQCLLAIGVARYELADYPLRLLCTLTALSLSLLQQPAARPPKLEIQTRH